MQTTLRLDDELYRQAKARAAACGKSLTQFLEEAVREHLHKAARPARRIRLPVCKATGGLLPGFHSLKEAIEAVELEADREQVGR